ncbi:MAG: ABC transporter permease [Candidatus Dormibacteria bacterium]
MTFYVIRRLGVGVALLLFMSVLFFALTRLTPGEPISADENPHAKAELIALRIHRLGLDKPWYQQYPAYLGDLARGDLGDSYQYHRPVTELLLQRIPNSAILLVTALAVSLAVGIPLGIFAATRQYSKLDIGTSVISYIGVSFPSFVLGLFLLGFAQALRERNFPIVFPQIGMHAAGQTDVPDLLMHMVLPVTSLAVISIAGFSRFMRSSMLEVLSLDYIRTARAKGLAAGSVNYKHALRNAILPIITLVALSIPQIVNGAIITEGIFSWPGMGLLAFQATVTRDYPIILGVVMLVAFLTVIMNLIADILYAVVDPRIRY